MTSGSRRSADALIGLAMAAAPPERQEWVEAMRAEVAHLPDRAARSFAIGCLWAAVRARAATSAFILLAVRWSLVGGAACWSGLNLSLASRLSAADAAVPAIVAYCAAAVFACGAVLTALLGLRAAAVLATPVLVLAGLVAAGAEALLPGSPNITLFRALALEDFTLLLMAILIALGAPGWVAAREKLHR